LLGVDGEIKNLIPQQDVIDWTAAAAASAVMQRASRRVTIEQIKTAPSFAC